MPSFASMWSAFRSVGSRRAAPSPPSGGEEDSATTTAPPLPLWVVDGDSNRPLRVLLNRDALTVGG
jgi:hypothetical protein